MLKEHYEKILNIIDQGKDNNVRVERANIVTSCCFYTDKIAYFKEYYPEINLPTVKYDNVPMSSMSEKEIEEYEHNFNELNDHFYHCMLDFGEIKKLLWCVEIE